jgi:hypothetical protein
MEKLKSNIISILVIPIFIIGITGCNPIPSEPDGYIYPLKLSENNRFLVDQKDKPFFWSGDAAWSLIVQLNREEVDFYLDDRKEKGFTVILVNLIDHKFGSNAPANIYNEPPFHNKPFISPNENYFSHADHIIRAAAERGIIVLLCPLYLGWQYGDEGWGEDVKKADLTDLRSWGQYVGKRFADEDNIIWCIGGDADPSQQKDKVLECVQGILEYDNRHLFTCHNNPEPLAISPWKGEDWLTINNVYSYSRSLYELCKTAYDQEPVMPYFMIESAYENEHNATPQQLRSEAYWPLLCGAMGEIFGNCPIWHFGSTPGWCGITDWKTQLNFTGSVSMNYLQRLFRSRPWHLLVPDFNHKVILDGYGDWGSTDYVNATCSSDGTTIIAYLPVGKQITVNLSKISSKKARCWWYNPGDASATEIGTYPAEDQHQFTPPTKGDWILVIDAKSSNYPVPGGERIY